MLGREGKQQTPPAAHSHHSHSHLPHPSASPGWPVELDIQEHIQRCPCTCDHMGYGNYLDYQLQQKQTTSLIELPDVTAPPLTTPGQNGSVRCNGRLVTYEDSSSSSSKDHPGMPRGLEIKMRHWCILCLVLVIAAAVGVGVGLPMALSSDANASPRERMELAKRVLREVPLVDGHNDLPWNIRKFVHNQIHDFNFTADLRQVEPWSRSPWSHTDLPRLQQGMIGAQLWSAYVPCGAQHLDAVQLTLEQIDVIRRLTDRYSAELVWVTSSEGIEQAHREGKIASLIGVEGGHSLGNSMAVLRMLYSLGARYLTLTHSCNTPWADCSSADSPGQLPEHNGLTSFGKMVIKELNRLGMLVDLSHASVQTIRDALAASKAPVIFSHSSAFALCNSSRNVPDDILRQVTLNGGLVMVSFYNYFITCNESATITDVIDHINHIRDIAGVEHVGIGAGYDGINYVPRGLEDVSKYPYLFAKLMEDSNWEVDDLKKLAGHNFLRVFRKVEEIRDKWQLAAVRPVEDLIPPQYLEGHTSCMYLGS